MFSKLNDPETGLYPDAPISVYKLFLVEQANGWIIQNAIRVKTEDTMGLIEVASGESVWRGMDYYKEQKVLRWEPAGYEQFDGTVQGESIYQVHLDIAHPRRSTCSCPFAKGRRVVCKHMIALYFTIRPQAASDFLKQVDEWEKEEEKARKAHIEELRKYVKRMSKSELQEKYLDALLELEERRNQYW